VRVGGVTWGWLDAAYRSSARLDDPAYLARITAPVLICQAGREVLVSNPAQRRLAARLPDATLKVYREAFHEILMERDTIRDAFWADFDTFLAEHGV
jgi:lysophospholipase